jgi:hypothetical protein
MADPMLIPPSALPITTRAVRTGINYLEELVDVHDDCPNLYPDTPTAEERAELDELRAFLMELESE